MTETAVAAAERAAAPVAWRCVRAGSAARASPAAGWSSCAPALWLTVFFLVPLAVVLQHLARARSVRPAALPAAADHRRGGHGAADAAPLQLHLPAAATASTSTPISARSRSPPSRRSLALLIGYPMAYAIARAAGPLAQHPADAGDPAVLDLVPAARLCLDRLPARQRRHQQLPRAVRHRAADHDAADRFRRLCRHRLLLPAVHDPAALHQPREARQSLLEASADLGARPLRTFLSITLPLSMPGIIAGSMLVFIPAIGEFVIPSLLGGPEHADDRPRALGRVLRQSRLAARRRGRHRHAAGRRRARSC